MPVARPESSDARVIAHVDMDCFYVQVEQRKQPELRGLPTAVVQYNSWKGGGLIAVSYEARKYGVKRSMRGDEAKQVCPQIQLVQVPVARGKADLNLYRNAGSEVVSILARKGRCERASIDEVYLDLTDAAQIMLAETPPESLEAICDDALRSHILGLHEDENNVQAHVRQWLCQHDADHRDKLLACGALIVADLRMQVLKETEFTCSAGIAHNKMLAKLASGMNKPAQQTVVPFSSVKALLDLLPVKKMKQLGGKLGNSLQSDLGVNTVGDLLQFSEEKLQERYGINTGTWLWNIARGICGEEVEERLLPKSHGSGKTFPGPRALRTIASVQHWLNELSEELSERLRSDLEQNKRIAHTLTLHARAYRSNDSDSHKNFPSKSCPLRYGNSKIQEDALNLFQAGLREYLNSYRVNTQGSQHNGWAITALSVTASKIVATPSSDKAKVVHSLLLVSGLNTLFQSFFGTRLPALVLSSYAYVIPATSIVISSRYASIADPHEKFEKTMRGIQGALIITALFQGIIGFMGFWRVVVRLLSPLSVVPLVTFTGLGLSLLGFPLLANCVEIGLPAILLMLLFSQYLVHLTKSKADLFDRYAVLFSVAAIWVYAVILTASGAYSNKPINTQTSCRTDRAGLITGAPWIYIPYPFQWGKPTFNPGEAFAMMAASVVALIESTGAFFALSRYGSATPVPPSVISRGAGWLGVGVILDGFFGTLTGSTISVENAGLLALTKVGSRRVSQMSALFMILSSIFGKFGAFFASIPSPILAAVNCICFGYVSSVGLDFLQFCNLNSFRTKSILGFSFFMGISIPQYFNQYHSNSRSGALYTPYTWFNDLVNVIFMSSAAVAVITALILDCTVGRKEESTRKDSGLHWWEKFYSYNTDVRSDEFYALPCKLNQYFPVI